MADIMSYESEPLFVKIDENTIEMSKQVVDPQIVTIRYKRYFIENQISAIQKQKDEFNYLRDQELNECYAILDSMDKLNIVTQDENIDLIAIPVPDQPISAG